MAPAVGFICLFLLSWTGRLFMFLTAFKQPQVHDLKQQTSSIEMWVVATCLCQIKTDWTSIRCSRKPNLLCFWFQCCSLSLAIQSFWLITQPIAASGQSQALYDSSQTTDRGAHSACLLFAHAPSSRVHHVCRLYRLLLCIVIIMFFQMFWRRWEMDPGF